jgi:hypothetical protein
MENGTLEPNIILVNWVNSTENTVQITWSGGAVTLGPETHSDVSAATLSELNVLSIEIQDDANTASWPDLLFIGEVMVATEVYQQVARNTPWHPVEYNRDLNHGHYSITLSTSPGEGLVIVGTVELVEPIPA